MRDKKLSQLVKGCKANKRQAQKELYKLFYNYGMTVCSRYAKNNEEAKEMLHDAFVKAFMKIDKYSHDLSFKAWFNRILVNTAIDYYRKTQNKPKTVDIAYAQHYETSSNIIEQLSVDEIFLLVQKLSPAYRLVFNLYVVDGLKHREIAEKLGISIGASKSNLAKARVKLQAMILANEKISKYAG